MSGPGTGMSGAVAMAVLAAALMHAGWNAMLKTRGDAFLSTVAVAVSAGLLCALALPWLPQPAPASWPYIAASALIHVVYYALLMATYREGDVSLAYPLMRGCAPLIVASFGLAFMGERLGAMQWLSICLICGGVLAMTGRARASTAANPAASRRTTLLALASAATIAAYTLVDGAGVRVSNAPAAYTMWIFAATAPGVAALALRRRRELLPFVRSNPALPIGGALSVGAYWVALWAMTHAPVAAVAALRETSILFATAIAVLVLRERVAPPRLAGAVLIACGAAAMRLG